MRPEDFTIGVEEEYQLVEPETGELKSRARLVLEADRSGAVEGEVQDTMLEIGTPVCTSASELADSLRERRFQASAAAAVEDLEIVSAGMHPFSSWWDHTLGEGERPRMLYSIFRQLLRQPHIWGMHLHVSIPEALDRAVIMNAVRWYGPHLLALSCSSPYQLGVDTGFSSYRAVAWRTFPFSGAPPRFTSDQEYQEFLDALIRAGFIPDKRTVYWSIRPSSRFQTLELRMCDAFPRIADAVSVAALGRALIVAAAEGRLPALSRSLTPSLQDEVLAQNEWITARDGLNAALIAPDEPTGKLVVGDAIVRLLDVVGPVAEELGDGEELDGVQRILESGPAADRIRQLAAAPDGMRGALDWLIAETRAGTGIDRRQADRAVLPEVVTEA